MPMDKLRNLLDILAAYYADGYYPKIMCIENGYHLVIGGDKNFGSFQPGDAFYSSINNPTEDIHECDDYIPCIEKFNRLLQDLGRAVTYDNYWAVCLTQGTIPIPPPKKVCDDEGDKDDVVDLTGHTDEEAESDEDGYAGAAGNAIDLTHQQDNSLQCFICCCLNCDHTMPCCGHKQGVHKVCLNDWFRFSFTCPCCKAKLPRRYIVDYSGQD
jgi:hypothetical protein